MLEPTMVYEGRDLHTGLSATNIKKLRQLGLVQICIKPSWLSTLKLGDGVIISFQGVATSLTNHIGMWNQQPQPQHPPAKGTQLAPCSVPQPRRVSVRPDSGSPGAAGKRAQLHSCTQGTSRALPQCLSFLYYLESVNQAYGTRVCTSAAPRAQHCHKNITNQEELWV